MKKIIVAITAILCMAFIFISAQTPDTPPVDTNTAGDAAAGAILAGADQEKNIDLQNIKNIELYDLEGNLILTFEADEANSIIAAYNSSMIDDTGYIEMITGSRMVINFNDGKTINLTSYGSETHVVAGGENFSHHLISPALAKILLEKR